MQYGDIVPGTEYNPDNVRVWCCWSCVTLPQVLAFNQQTFFGAVLPAVSGSAVKKLYAAPSYLAA